MAEVSEFIHSATSLRVRTGRMASPFVAHIVSVYKNRLRTRAIRPRGNVLEIQRGDAAHLMVLDRTGQYSFPSEVLDVRNETDGLALVFELPEQATHTQRRQFVRAEIRAQLELTYFAEMVRNVDIDPSFAELPNVTPAQSSDANMVAPMTELAEMSIKGTTSDISEGGMRVRLLQVPEVEPAVGTTVDINLVLSPAEEPLQGKAKLVWRGPESKQGLVCGFEFQNLSRSERARIFRHVLAFETALHKKGFR